MTTSRRTVVLVAAFALLTAINPDPAHAYPEKGFRCVQSATTGGTVSVSWPSLTSISGSAENVYFLTMLHRWQNGRWEPYRMAPATASGYPTTWYAGMSNSAGPMLLNTISNPYYFTVGGTWANEPAFPVPAGHYAVLEYYGWTNGRISQQWATLQSNNTGAWYQPTTSTYCTIK